MPYDTLMMTAAVAELAKTVTGGRIQKISQPERLELLLHVYTREGMRRVVISADPIRARLHLTRRDKGNPPVPPPFCLVMRKRVEGARIESVEQVPWERVTVLELSTHDELGTPRRRRLLVEAMGKHSNVVLVDEAGVIIDALKRIGAEENRYRLLVPGEKYIPPPPAGKLDPDQADADAVRAVLTARGLAGLPVPLTDVSAGSVADALRKDVRGLGPVVAFEAVARARAAMAGADAAGAGGAPGLSLAAALAKTLAEVIAPARGLAPFAPTAYTDEDGSVTAFSAIPLSGYAGLAARSFQAPGEMLDFVYGRAEQSARFRQTLERLRRAIEATQSRVARRAEAQREELSRGREHQQELTWGELIKQNLHQITAGAAEFTATDWSDPDQRQVTVPLDRNLTPVENAQRYFKRYARGKKTVAAAEPRLAATESELRYLEEVASSLAVLDQPGGPSAEDEAALAEIRAELIAAGYVKPEPAARQFAGKGAAKPASRSAGAPAASSPLRFVTSSGKEVLVGRNNRQNDLLTLKTARPDDLWLHVKDIPGSHVILRRDPAGDFTEDDLVEGPNQAAYHSRGRQSSRVPVDYAARSHVRKPSGARPGMVIYDHHRTVYVTPEAAEVERLKPKGPVSPPPSDE
ncbi:MAG: Rqc2 family fibronectin-binding protein [Bacillota bacterium]